MFKAQDEDILFLETFYLRKRQHLVVECLPLPKELGDTAPIYFKVRWLVQLFTLGLKWSGLGKHPIAIGVPLPVSLSLSLSLSHSLSLSLSLSLSPFLSLSLISI